jgi:hypothetical protein
MPLSALSVVALVRGASGFVAGLCRVAMFVFAVTYTAFDTAAGIVTGVLLQAAHETDTPEAWRGPVMAIWEHPILGGSRNMAPLLAIVGALAWLVGCGAVTATVAPGKLGLQQELAFTLNWARGRRLVRPGQHAVLVEGEMPGQPTSRAVVVRTVMSSDQVSDGVAGGT